jgi:hypothetical protein
MQIRRIGKYNQFSAFASHKMVNGPVVAIDDMLQIEYCAQALLVVNLLASIEKDMLSFF